jgi:hypothetical protein
MIGLPDHKSCFACESMLGPIDGLMVTCSNDRCDAGGKFQTCGFCRQFALAMGDVTRICWNEDCQSHNVPFTFCGKCRRYSVRLISGEHRCISRHCPSNKGQLANCFYCDEQSLFSIKDFKICFKSNCSRRGIQVDQCFFCQKMSFILVDGHCLNANCKKFQAAMEPCEKCNKRTFPKEDFECFNSRCGHKLPMENFMKKSKRFSWEALKDLEESSDTLFDLKAVAEEIKISTQTGEAPSLKTGAAVSPEAFSELTQPENSVEIVEDEESRDPSDEATLNGPGPRETAEPKAKSESLAPSQALAAESLPLAMGQQSSLGSFINSVVSQIGTDSQQQGAEAEAALEAEKEQALAALAEEANAALNGDSRTDREDPVPDRTTFSPAVELGKGPQPPVVVEANSEGAKEPEKGEDIEEVIEEAIKDLEDVKKQVLSESEAAEDGHGSKADGIFSDILDEAWPGSKAAQEARDKALDIENTDEASVDTESEETGSTSAPARFRNPVGSWLSEEPKVHFRTKKAASRRASGSSFKAPGGGELRRDSEAFRVISPEQEPAVQPIHKATGEQGSLLEAYQILNDSFLHKSQSTCPFYLVIGLPGSGKTTYLSMLGDILYNRQQKYFFPYKDITAKQIQIQDLVTSARRKDRRAVQSLSKRLRDLVYDFSRPQYDRFLSRGFWPPFTGKNERFFLLTEILKKNQPMARVSTLEVAGEHYRDLLENALFFRDILQSPARKEFALASMLNRAHGILILLNPMNSHEDDKVYANFFRLLSEHLKPRAMQSLYETIQHLLENPRDFQRYRLHQKVRKSLRDIGTEADKGQRINNQSGWERLFDAFKKVDKRGFDSQRREREQRLEPFRSKANDSAEIEEKNREQRRRIGREFDRRLLEAMSRQIDDIVSIELKRVQNQKVEKITEDVVLETMIQYHELPADFEIDLEQRASQTEFFPNLCRINIAITKADQYSICYPPGQYPKRRLRYSRDLLAQVEGYLKLLGGELRYYNTSATGYTYILNNRYFPGTADFHCPINVVEPFFDMLDIKADHQAGSADEAP